MIARNIGKAHTWIYRRTGGRVGGKLRLGAGFRKPAPTLLLEHRGRKSGKTFVSPLLYITDHSNVIVVASALGRTENPGGIAIYSHIPMSTFRSDLIAGQLVPSSLARMSGRVYGHAWWMPTPTSTRIKVGPSVRSR